jgi:hypothetical protein
MKVVRQRKFKPEILCLALLGISLFLSSCNPTEIKGKASSGSVVSNNSNGALDGKAYIYRDSPYILAGKNYSPNNPNMSNFIDRRGPELITLNTQLTSNCLMTFGGSIQAEISNCIHSLKNNENLQDLPRKDDRTWIFAPGSPEFYQVNTLYHLDLGTKAFFKKLAFAYDRVNSLTQSVPRSIPPYLRESGMFWFKGVSNIDSKLFRNGYLNVFSQCQKDGNASFSPAGPELCFGSFSQFPGLNFAQDPSVIYHELGHAFVSIMMNLRNGTGISAHALRSNLGSYGYDEAGSINEGIADYFSYIMNKRTHFGEWSLGKTVQQSRPLSEDDDMHIQGISTTSEGRLSYPQYLLYDPNHPESLFEDVHYAGQIAGHYFVALTTDLKNKCFPTSTADEAHDGATSYVLLLLVETLSELGDLNAKGIDNYWLGAPFASSIYFNNLDPVSSYLWAQHINQPTYRKLFQIFAKNINKFISSATIGLCPQFAKNDSEKLLDDYGLLLFRTYNDNGNSTSDRAINYTSAVSTVSTLAIPTPVSENNRRKSVLISKQLIDLAAKTDATPNAVAFYIIDDRANMENLLKDLLFKGYSVPLSTNVTSTDYNNANIKISPGEIVAVIPNLHNASNSVMAGVQLLGSDWDHVHIKDYTNGNFSPCVVDSATTLDQGGEAALTCLPANGHPDKTYRRLVSTTTPPAAPLYPSNAAAPACLVLLEEGESSKWVSQNEFRKKQGLALQDKDCLGYSSSGQVDADFSFNPHECLVRFVPGASDAFFSTIQPQKNYYDSVVKDSESKEFNSGNLMMLEVNKWIPPGTKFRCRLRARFTNCSDCYTDGSNANDDFLDSDYNGYRPYKVINFDFDVND